jgi:hypothetical protein
MQDEVTMRMIHKLYSMMETKYIEQKQPIQRI